MFRNVTVISMATSDADGAKKLYTDVLGLVPVPRTDEIERGPWRRHVFRIDDIMLEMMQPLVGPEAPGSGGGMARFLQRHGEGLYHATVSVDDPERYLTGLESKGVKIIWDRPDPRHAEASAATRTALHLIHPSFTHGVLWAVVPHRPNDFREKAPMNNAFKRVKHIAVMCRDNDKALKTYTEVLGLDRHVRSTMYERGRYREHTLAIGDVALELLQPLDGPDAPGPGGGMARFLERYGEGLFLVTVDVEDPATYAKGLEAKGVKVYWDVPDYGDVVAGRQKPAYAPPLGGDVHPLIHPRHTHGVLWELDRHGTNLATI